MTGNLKNGHSEARGGILRALELFCGIGGFAAALDEVPWVEVAAALDINQNALAVYRYNFPRHATLTRNADSLPAATLAAYKADLWWLSPPCQPFTVRGFRRDAEDPRARPFLALIERISELRPLHVMLENVAGFRGSKVHTRLLRALERAGYAAVEEHLLCPSELGLPNRRPRYYLVASRRVLEPARAAGPVKAPPLATFLDPETEPSGLEVEPEVLRRYAGALHVVEADDPAALTNCFTSAYGRSHVRSGSYLQQHGRIRRFSPREILRLLGFPAGYEWPPGLPRQKAWRLAGNSLSLPAVRRMLTRVATAD